MSHTIYHLVNGGPLHLLASCLSSTVLLRPPGWAVEHTPVFWGGERQKIVDRIRDDRINIEAERCEFVAGGLHDLVRWLKHIDKEPCSLIIHGIYHRFFWFALRRVPGLLARTSWISWGGGVLSPWRHYPIGLNPMRYVWFRPYRYCVPRLAAVSVQTDDEFERLETMVGPLGNRSEARYFHPCLPARFEQRPAHTPLKVCVGHRATVMGDYERAFGLLERFADRPMEVHVPLSYGNDAIVADVIALGRRKLGEAFRPLTEFMTMGAYYDFLREMDVLVMPQGYAVGGFNCTYCLAVGGKVYLSPENTYLQRNRDEGCRVFELDELAGVSFEELAEPLSPEVQRENFDVLARRGERAAEKMHELYEQLVPAAGRGAP